MSHEALGDNPTTIKNILLPRKKTNKILRLISCTRIDPEKGWNRMLRLMEMMKTANIKFEWNIFTNNPQKCDYEEVHFYKSRYDIWDYLANSHYTVLLSDSERIILYNTREPTISGAMYCNRCRWKYRANKRWC